MKPTDIIYFVHISDTHIGPTADYRRFGLLSLSCARKLVSVINNLPVKPDFVIHTGDVVADPDIAAYQLAAETFAQLEMPIYYVTGNHDQSRLIHKYLPMGTKRDLSDNLDLLTYAFEVKGYQFLVVDARGPDEIDPHGLLSDEQLHILHDEIGEDGPPLSLFMHFPTLPLNSTWMDAYMLTINGRSFYQAIEPAKKRLRGVFYGHVHQNIQTMYDGMLHVSVGSAFSQFSAWPGELTTGFDHDHLPAYNFVHMMPEQTIIHQHTFPRPE